MVLVYTCCWAVGEEKTERYFEANDLVAVKYGI